MALIFTNLPEKGDAAVGNLLTGKVEFIKGDSYEASLLDLAAYEKVGAVVRRQGKVVTICGLTQAAKKWSDRYSWKLTGYTLDGTGRTGVLSIREASNSWASNVDYTVPYNASTVAEMAEQLNAFFANNANPVFQTQDWYAETDGENITLTLAYTDYRQSSYNTGKTGFTLAANFLPDVAAHANVRRKNGYNGGEGAIHSYYRALAYFRQDLNSTTYNPNTEVTSKKRGYPVCLPGYLGTSAYRVEGGVQKDYCSLLRATYGEGEAGWLNFMHSCEAVWPCDWGNMGMLDGLARTKVLAEKTYTSQVKTNEPTCPAAKYCYDYATVTMPQGKWHLPTMDEIMALQDGVKYPSEGNNRMLDPLNAILYKMGGSDIGNNRSIWSCLRNGASGAWLGGGSGGCLGKYYFYSSSQAVPVALYLLP